MPSSRFEHRAILDSALHIAACTLGPLALLSLVAGALGAQPHAKRVVAHPSAESCLATSPLIVDARLDVDHPIYVEQETVQSQRDGRLLVAGEPVFLWERRGERYELLEQDSLVGVIISPPSTVRALVSPLRGRSLAAMRSAALPDGWWLLTFAEVIPAPVPQPPKVLAMWVGETDGASWRGIERLPAVPDSLDVRQLGELSWRDGRAHLVVQSWRDGQPRVVLYSREGGRWNASSMRVGPRAYATAATTASHAVLAIVRPDTTEPEDINSLFLASRAFGDSVWSPAVRIVRGFRSPVRDPLLTKRRDGLLLSWRVESADQRKQTAWFMNLGPGGEPNAPGYIASEAGRLTHTARRSRGVWAVMQNARPLRQLQLVEHDASSTPTAVVVSATTYGGVIAAALTAEYYVLIASQPGRSSDEPAVVSTIRTYPWRCD
jgi:hypothetical protein